MTVIQLMKMLWSTLMKNTWVPVKGYYTCKRQNLFKMWAVKLKDLKDESEACGKPC